MAQLGLALAGAAAGAALGGPFGASVGFTLGSVAGQLLFPTKGKASSHEGPRLSDLAVQDATLGKPRPLGWGAYAISPQIIWKRPLREVATTTVIESEGGKGGGGGSSSTQTTFTYFGNFALGLGVGEIAGIGRIWADGKLIREQDGSGNFESYLTIYVGSETQTADPTIESYEGAGNVPGFRGEAYLVWTDLPLADWGNRIPNFKIEVFRSEVSALAFDSNFIVENLTLGLTVAAWEPDGHTTDSFGNLVVTHYFGTADRVAAVSPAGTKIWEFERVPFTTLIYDFLDDGRSVFASGGGPHVAPILNGTWLIGTIRIFDWNGSASTLVTRQYVALMRPVASGDPEVVAVVSCRMPHSSTGNNWTDHAPHLIMVSGAQTESDAILITCNTGDGAGGLLVFPSVDDLQENYDPWVFEGNPFLRGEIPLVMIKPLVSVDFWSGLYDGNLAGGYWKRNAGWCLPSSGGGTDLYFYFSRPFIAAHVAAGSGYNAEVKNVIGPTYPNGCVVKVPLGTIDWNVTLFGWHDPLSGEDPLEPVFIDTADSYSVVNADFGGAVPFLDEYTLISTGAVSGADYYEMRPFVQKRTGNSYVVAFTMKGNDDAFAQSPQNEFMYARVKLFTYNPVTGIFTLAGTEDGAIFASATDMTVVSGSSLADDRNTMLRLSGSTLYLWGVMGGGAGQAYTRGAAYLTQFGTFDLDGSTTLEIIVREICELCGMVEGTDFDVTGIEGQPVRGYVIGREVSGRSALEPLRDAFFFDGVESDGLLKFIFRDGISLDVINEDDLAATSAPSGFRPKVTEIRQQEVELPKQIVLAYMAQNREYQQGTQQAQRPSEAMRSRDVMSLEFPIVLDDTEGKQIAEKMLYQSWIARVSIDFDLPIRWLALDPGDVVTVNYDGATLEAYILSAELGGDNVIKLSAVGTDALVFVDSPSVGVDPTITSTLREFEDSTLYLLDTPLLRDSDDEPGYYAGGHGITSAWRGERIYRSVDGITFSSIATIGIPAAAGVSDTALPAASHTVFDRTNTLRVTLSYGELSSVSDELVLAGVNAAFYGDELIGFATATLISTVTTDGVTYRTYDLSDLLRGRRGSDWATEHDAVGERFIVLKTDGSIKSITTNLADNGILRHFKGVSIGQLSADVPAQTFTPEFIRLKPLAPVNIDATRDGSNNVTITWNRRTRKPIDPFNGIDQPLDEPIEAYEIDVISGSPVLRTINASSMTATYSAADQTSDGLTPGDPIQIEVYMISNRVGRGYAGSATV